MPGNCVLNSKANCEFALSAIIARNDTRRTCAHSRTRGKEVKLSPKQVVKTCVSSEVQKLSTYKKVKLSLYLRGPLSHCESK
jgi:hypothetical protein